ncbi:MAG TPA: hypothetical protein VGC54_09555 [Planctomycetota bacterium]
MRTIRPLFRIFTGCLAVVLLLSACLGGGGGLTKSENKSAGAFMATGWNIRNGAVWELNKPIRIEFSNPVDANSVSFRSILVRPVSAAIQGKPVTGAFEFEVGSGNRVLIFRPACPTSEKNDNGGLVPGGYTYEISLPTQANFGSSVLRDTGGHSLTGGFLATFRTPVPPAESLFVDFVAGPPAIVGVTYPSGLNFFSDPDPFIEVEFDQPIDGRSSNLNTARLYFLYSNEEIGAGGPTFPAANVLPGRLILAENCVGGGAKVLFQISGLLPPNRLLRLFMTNQFADLAGQTNSSNRVWPEDHATPTLADVYQDPTWVESDETIDEFADGFDTAEFLDLGAPLPLPPATVGGGAVSAAFDFAGAFVPDDADFVIDDPFLEIFTDGTTVFTDSNNRNFTVVNGVVNVNDFTITISSTLRARGRNPLIVYASGTVKVDGTLDCSGNTSHWPTALNSPQFPEGGAVGELGGGDGGTSSHITNAETPRGQSGDGPFGQAGGGGGGGEGGVQQSEGLANSGPFETVHVLAAGGAGGNFAKTPNEAVVWPRWTGAQNPTSFDTIGPDHDAVFHPEYNSDDYVGPPAATGVIRGAERGNRGSSFKSINGFNNDPHGIYGMEDVAFDAVAYDGNVANGIELQCDWIDPKNNGTGPANGDPEFVEGHPTNGADPGVPNQSPFSADVLGTANDFWGRRLSNDGSVIVGELLAPWAGYGGGASGDSQVLRRYNPTTGIRDPLTAIFPDRPWILVGGPRTNIYRKGAPGGGGGGQLMILAIGPIRIGARGAIHVDGGGGHGGESAIYDANQVSGSGGGSGGHLVLHSATELDLSQVSGVGTDPGNPVPVDIITAIGGRRGWCASALTNCNTLGRYNDGNNDYMIGRGGAGSNGLIQIHVPDPGTNIKWPTAMANAWNNYVHGGGGGGPTDIDRVEELLAYFTAPGAYALIPFFSSTSTVWSKWIDTGLAGLRDPLGSGDYPHWLNGALSFAGVDTGTGRVKTTGTGVTPLGNVFEGPVAEVTLDAFQITVPGASTRIPAQHLRHPKTLEGYDVLPDVTDPRKSFEVKSASYDRGSDVLVLVTNPVDGGMSLFSGATWGLRQKFFRIATSGVKDFLPGSTSMVIEFQAAGNPADPGSYAPIAGNVNAWSADMSSFDGKRFLRYRVVFDIAAGSATVSLNSPRPTLDYIKIPFVW